MARDRDELLRRIEETLSTISSWLAVRRSVGGRHLERLRARLESVRREIGKESAEAAHDALVRIRAGIEDLERDETAPRPPAALRREELQALKHHLQLTAALLPRLSNLDDPGWRLAHAEYERSWDRLTRAFDSGAAQPSP